MLITADQARKRIQPIESVLVDAYKSAVEVWRDLVNKHPAFALPLDATARANFLHCHFRDQVDRRIADRAHATVNDRLGFYALLLHPDVLLRIKYVGNGDGAPHNYPTYQQRLLARQNYDVEMLELLGLDPSLAPPTFLTCGYTLDGLEPERLEIRRDCRGRQSWSFDIYGGETLIEPLVFDGMGDDTKPARVASSRNKRGKDAEQAEGA